MDDMFRITIKVQVYEHTSYKPHAHEGFELEGTAPTLLQLGYSLGQPLSGIISRCILGTEAEETTGE